MSNEQDQTKQKPGPKAVTAKQFSDLQNDFDNLKACVSKICHYAGTERILDEFKIDRWTPGQKDMKKYKD